MLNLTCDLHVDHLIVQKDHSQVEYEQGRIATPHFFCYVNLLKLNS